jgi:hypothetical protein
MALRVQQVWQALLASLALLVLLVSQALLALRVQPELLG